MFVLSVKISSVRNMLCLMR